jgi:hypothetical protein
MNSVAYAAVEGKLDKRANSSAYEGEFKEITCFNATLDAVIGPLMWLLNISTELGKEYT